MNKEIIESQELKKLNIFKNETEVICGRRSYKTIDTDGYFIKVIPYYPGIKLVASEGYHFIEKESRKDCGQEVQLWYRFLDENDVYHKDPIYEKVAEDYECVRNER